MVLWSESKIRLHVEHNKDKWEFTAKVQDGGSVDGKLLRSNTKGLGGFWLHWLLLTAGQSRLTLPAGLAAPN